MVLNLLDQTLLGEVFHHGRARLVAVKPLVGAGLLGHATFFVDHHEARQFMAERDLKVTPAHDPNDFEIALRHKLSITTRLGRLWRGADFKSIGGWAGGTFYAPVP